ncbi:C40 family peptidase [Planotetraspora kaengkrachanensis]|uniref:C40 family peptidase n=1 Tax=Planotetraspora kaengkrachanensis TaxID=575193 RepID=UPI001EF16C78|nr:C40 family peptidase [Planotetraspora kaengkrachanensis]
MLDARARLTRVVSEVRQDLAFIPRMPRRDPHRRIRSLRRTLPLIGALLASVLILDVVVLAELTGREPDKAAFREQAPQPVRDPGGFVAATAPAVAPTPAVAPLKKLIQPHLLVVAAHPLPPEDVAEVRDQKGVTGAEVVDAAEVRMDGKRVQTLGVEPSTFRPYAPKSTAKSDALWANIAAGDMAVSFDLGKDGGLTLGSTVDGGGRQLRVGAYATVGMGSISAVVSRQTARSLGIPTGNALVVSAPKADSGDLRAKLLKLLPKGSQVATINPVVVERRGRTAWPTTAFMSTDQIQVALQAAQAKLGRPYVWGAEGPDSFDCSGLVQWAFAQAGVRMPRVAAQQWAAGPQIPLSQARPGDLIFWRNDPTNPGYISHVAIYWGDGKMLVAPHTGDVVKFQAVYTKNLAGVVRVSPAVARGVR